MQEGKKMLSLKQGIELVKIARKSISLFMYTGRLPSEQPEDKMLLEKQGVFVTLNKGKNLRGCIGFPMPEIELWNAVKQAAASAAFKDPRFNPLQAGELEKTRIEVSVLSKPQELKCGKEELVGKIRVGTDGLIISRNYFSGLLLPQVAAEWKWNAKQFLEQCCVKAGLDKNAWKEKETKVSVFQAQVFKELNPEGKVIEEKLEKTTC